MAKGKAKAKDENTDEGAKPKGGMLKMLLGAVLLLGVGAGGAYGAFAAGLLGGEVSQEADVPKLVRKGESDPYEMPGDAKGDEAIEIVHGEGGSEYRTAYYSFEDGFTSNLSDTAGLIQVELAASTQRDGRVLQWLKTHELAIRSAILVQLAATPEDDVYSVEGRKRLSKRLADAINAVLEENEGYGGVEGVHFKAFLVQ
ncbi:MAG: flagellar basal body-associated FliL family protein [Pseudomonadota bacterium]